MDLLKEVTLGSLRDTLVRLEDTITFAFIERAQFCTNQKIYEPGALAFDTGFNGTFLEYFLHEVETVHAKVRRYTSPDEYPFSKDLPNPVIPELNFPAYLKNNDINLNPKLYKIYVEKIVPAITKPGDDQNYGTSATRDVEVLQALSRRVHYGKFIAEAKFRDPKLQPKYIELIKCRDSAGIEALLTNTTVEEKLLRRLVKKATIYGGEIEDDDDPNSRLIASPIQSQSDRLKIQPNVVSQVYKEFIIPLTKEVEVEYLLKRLDD